MQNEKQAKEQQATDKLAKKQMTENSEMQQIPTEGKKPGEIDNFKKSVHNNKENENKLKDQK